MGGSLQRITDTQGHAWPVTGYWCAGCGMPLHSILRTAGVHPSCDDTRPTSGPAEYGAPAHRARATTFEGHSVTR